MRPHSLSCTSRRLQSRGARSLATQGAPVAGRGADAAVAHVPVARLAVRHGGAAVAQRLVAPHAVLDPLVVVGHGGAVDTSQKVTLVQPHTARLQTAQWRPSRHTSQQGFAMASFALITALRLRFGK